MSILVLNAGSSSLRFTLFDDKLRPLYRGHADALGQKQSSFRFQLGKDPEKQEPVHLKTHQEALRHMLKKLKEQGLDSIQKVAHRVVHGGEKFKKATPITATVLKEIERLSPFAPLHNPANLTGILAAQKALPKAKHYAIFDTAFHQSLPEHAFLYGLPYSLYKKQGLRRYGFHGTSHKFIASETAKLLKKRHLRLITCHLGNGVSLTAIENGLSKDTTMGFTPLEGPMMGTRSGSIDPALVLHLVQNASFLKKSSLEKVHHLLEKESGFLGVSEISADIRDLWAKPKAAGTQRTFAIFSYQIAQHIAKLLPALSNTPHAIVFTAGIGTYAYYLRTQICEYLEFLGVRLNKRANEENQICISAKNSKIKILVLPTNEELQMAREVQAIR